MSPATPDRPAEGLNVAIVSREYPPLSGYGGIGAFSQSLAAGLAELGARVDVISCVDDIDRPPQHLGAVTVHRVAPNRGGRIIRRVGARYPVTAAQLRGARAVRSTVRNLSPPPHVIEAPEWMAESLLLSWPRRRTPVVVHLHGSLDALTALRGERASTDIRRAIGLEWFAVRRARMVTAPSAAGVRLAPRHPQGLETKVRTVGMPVPRELLSQPLAEPASDPIVAMVGRLDHLKAPDVLLEAAGLLRPDIPRLRVIFVGADSRESPDHGDFSEWLRRRASELGVPIEVKGHQPHESVFEVYSACRAVVVASIFESYSMVATEAMALGRPVVVTSACGVAGLVAKLNRDRVVPPRDPAALAAALGPLLRDPALAAKEGMAARALVNETCDPARVAAERLELYAELGAFQSKPTSLFSNSV